ncbi:MAG TPA: hypothetical protein VKU90_10375 [Caulobacteraceae bacterium]|nr:hypothetical protein [Caulobacteraceae bacterium]
MTVESFIAEGPAVTNGLDQTLDNATQRARRAYTRTVSGVRAAAHTVDPFVKERPYLALGLSLAAGVLLGVLWLGRPKVVYVRPTPAE